MSTKRKRKPTLTLCAGGAAVPIAFERPPASPFRALRKLRWNGRLYHQALAAEILDPFLERWSAVKGDERPLLGAVTEAAMARCLAAFHGLRMSLRDDRDEAIFAALTVTANLQRTLTGLAERLARAAEGGEAKPEIVVIARPWCGFAPARSQPVAASRWRALGCSPLEIEPRCQEALRSLRCDLRQGQVLAGDDLAGYANRSGAVRLRKSSM